ncbi:MAG: prolyl oligopeptidase family serine peptidase [Pyrinomonadaceae bacterium]
MKNFIKLTLCLIFLAAAQNFSAQNVKDEFLRREVKIGGETYGYRVYVPQNRDVKKKLPVMMFLHGNGANGTDNEKQVAGFEKVVFQNPKIFNFIIVFPQARPNTFWIGEQTEQASKALDQTIAEFNGDSQRLYLAGHSMGGYGTWTTAALYPHKFAALVPISGGIVPPFKLPPTAKLLFPKELIAIVESQNPYDALAEKIGNTPVWDFHGAEDEAVPVTESRNIIAALKKKGNKNVNYTEYPKTDHNGALIKAFSEPKLYKWLAEQKLNK